MLRGLEAAYLLDRLLAHVQSVRVSIRSVDKELHGAAEIVQYGLYLLLGVLVDSVDLVELS